MSNFSQHEVLIECNAMTDQEGQDRDEDNLYLQNCLCAGWSHTYLQIYSWENKFWTVFK